MISQAAKKADMAESIEFELALEQTKSLMDSSLLKAPIIIRSYTAHLAQVKGKFIRAVSVLSCAQGNDGKVHPNAVKLAAAIEILHLATLVHDDVIDNAKTRRGIPTLHKKYGKRTAVICGDYLLCLALKISSSVENREEYINLDVPQYMGRICLGELNQHINNGNLNLSVYNYLKIIAGKTASLFEASFYGGAILCPNAKDYSHLYQKLGRSIGMIFQLSDDCIDFEDSQELAKKPVQSDYEQGVITLPLIHALHENEDFKEKASKQGVSRSEINSVVRATGGLDFTRMVSKRYYNRAVKIMDKLSLTDDKRKKLTAILDKAYNGLKK